MVNCGTVLPACPLDLKLAATPLLCGELLERLVVGCVAITLYFLLVQKIVHVFGEHGTNRMHGIMPLEPFADQTSERFPDGCLILKSQLIFDDRVKQGVNRPRPLGQVYPCVSMISLHEQRSLVRIERQPLNRIWWNFGIVALHWRCQVTANVELTRAAHSATTKRNASRRRGSAQG